MKSRVLRTLLVALFVGAAGGAAYVVWTAERQVREHQDRARTFQERLRGAARQLLELQSAQQGYVAVGQGEGYWIERAAERMALASGAIAGVRGASGVPEAQSFVDEAAAALRAFEQLDRRARDYARSGQKLLASDLIFSDGTNRTAVALAALDQAFAAEARTRDSAIRELRRRQLIAVGSAAGGALMIVLLLTPLPRPNIVPAAAPVASEPAGALELRTVRTAPGSKAGVTRDGIRPRPAADAPVQRPAAPVQPPPSSPLPVNLSGVAELCIDLAKLDDTSALPSALARAAQLLDATGIVLWMGDGDGRRLSPILTHGYTPAVVARLGTIARDADNATAAAYRTGMAQTVRGDDTAASALAAPLVKPDGCVGVMAAELRGTEIHESKLATARILAAQLATLVGPAPSERAVHSEVAGA